MDVIENQSQKNYLTLPQKIFLENERIDGGPSPDAVWALDIPSIHKIILICIASKLDPTKNLVGEYVSVSIEEIASQTSCSKSKVIRTIGGQTGNNKNKHSRTLGLIEMGYIKKIIPSATQRIQNHIPNQYCLTEKIFDEYVLKLIELEKDKNLNYERFL